MRKFAILLCCLSTLIGVGSAQKKFKPWTEWSEKDCKKILEDSPWSQTQTETDTSEMFFSPTTQSGAGSSPARNERGALNQATNINYRIRFLSAKPVRQALAKAIAAKQPELADSLKTFVDRDYSMNNPFTATSYNAYSFPSLVNLPKPVPSIYFLQRFIDQASFVYECD